jgi:hypothetical protein
MCHRGSCYVRRNGRFAMAWRMRRLSETNEGLLLSLPSPVGWRVFLNQEEET